MTVFPLLAVLTTSASGRLRHAIWDPVHLTGKFTNPVVMVFALFSVRSRRYR